MGKNIPQQIQEWDIPEIALLLEPMKATVSSDLGQYENLIRHSPKQ